MMLLFIRASAVVAAVCVSHIGVWVVPASAQELVHRGWIHVNGSLQLTTTTFSDRVEFIKDVEEGDTYTEYSVGGTAAIDVMGGVHLWRFLGAGVGLTQFSQTDVSTTATARSPHPFYFNRHRVVTGPASTDRTDTQINIFGLVLVEPIANRVMVTVFGGPTIFRVRQELVSGINAIEAYPYDAPVFERHLKSEDNVAALGFNIGADVAVFFSRYVGAGGTLRFTRATLDFRSADNDILSTKAGGIYVGGGVRFRF